MSNNAIVLLSGGLDSAVALGFALNQNYDEVIAVNFFYGQRHVTEMDHALELVDYYNIPNQTLHVEHLFSQVATSSLIGETDEANPSVVPNLFDSSLPATFVPGRNLVFISAAAMLGYKLGAYDIIGGWNAVDYSGYPDCRKPFLLSLQATLNLAMFGDATGDEESFRRFRIYAPLVDLSKSEIIRLGVKFNVPLNLTWSCYSGGDVPCGECDSCKIRAAGFAEAGIEDPALV